jgi:bifunctional ADP-heptose synthase (sugar kinase/adenylyltransferase)
MQSNPGMAGNVYSNLQAFDCDVTLLTGKNNCYKKRYVDSKSKQHIIRVDYESHSDAFDVDSVKDYNLYDAVVISDYAKGFITERILREIRNRYDGLMFIDTKLRDLKPLSHPKTYIKINALEYSRLISDCSNLVVTLGKDGARYQGKIYPSPKVELADVCGAGDTYLAALAYFMTATGNIETAIQMANICGAIAVSHNGVYALKREDWINISLP